MKSFVAWLDASWLSQVLQANLWLIPLIQSVHIVALTVMMGSAFILLLRALGLANRREPAAETAGRYLPRMWATLVIMAITGSLLVIAEPNRSLRNPAFWSKMGLIVASVLTTLALAGALRRQVASQGGGEAIAAKRLAMFGFVLWSAVLITGRWIAYVDVN